jgi:hypothetical protein
MTPSFKDNHVGCGVADKHGDSVLYVPVTSGHFSSTNFSICGGVKEEAPLDFRSSA